MKTRRIFLLAFVILFSLISFNTKAQQKMMVRIAEIEIHPEYLNEYINILKEEAGKSVALEKGVIAIFPMYQQKEINQIRILEIYADSAAYMRHLTTPHFIKYKTSTAKMVKSLRLVDMEAIDPKILSSIFVKQK